MIAGWESQIWGRPQSKLPDRGRNTKNKQQTPDSWSQLPNYSKLNSSISTSNHNYFIQLTLHTYPALASASIEPTNNQSDAGNIPRTNQIAVFEVSWFINNQSGNRTWNHVASSQPMRERYSKSWNLSAIFWYTSRRDMQSLYSFTVAIIFIFWAVSSINYDK